MQVVKAQDILQLWYPYQLNVLPDCNTKPIVNNISFTTNSKEVVGLYSFKSNSNEFILLYNGKQVQKKDTISLSEAQPAIFEVKFDVIPRYQDSLFVSFETTIDGSKIFKKGIIQLHFKKYVITKDEISTQKEQVLELSKSCLDSIRVYFPYGGTETNISLHNNPNDTQEPIKSIWYQFGSIEKNYITFSKKDIGKYYVRLASCWWGAGFWLTIK
jgi:hypothetical protein